MHETPRQRGFSLVELAIVLVIISLIAGLVIKGFILIERGRVKQVVKNLNELHTASLTYLDRFRAVPGDDPSHHGMTTPAQTNPGDGKIDDPADFWQQLHDAGLVNGTGAEPLITPWGTPFSALYNAAAIGDNAICVLLPAEVASELERNYDDNSGTTGGFRLAKDDQGMPATTATATTTGAEKTWVCTRSVQKLVTSG